jgi:hypothetical protein
LFEQTLVEAIEKLRGLSDVEDLRREVVAMQALFRSWRVRTPRPEDRAAAISRLMSLYRAVEAISSEHK